MNSDDLDEVTSQLSDSQVAAIKFADECAHALLRGEYVQLGESIVQEILNTGKTIPDVVRSLRVQEALAPDAHEETINIAVRKFIKLREDAETILAIARQNAGAKRAQGMAQINITYQDRIAAGRKNSEGKEMRAQRLREWWGNANPEEVRRIASANAQKAAERLIELGNFDYGDPELVNFFLALCNEVVITNNKRLNGSPDFNKIAEIMRDIHGYDKSRGYWGAVHYRLKLKGHIDGEG